MQRSDGYERMNCVYDGTRVEQLIDTVGRRHARVVAIESNNATMNRSPHLLEVEIFGLEMKLWTQCSNRG